MILDKNWKYQVLYSRNANIITIIHRSLICNTLRNIIIIVLFVAALKSYYDNR